MSEQYWDQFRGDIYSDKGGWRIGEGVFVHGYSLLDELVGEKSYFQLLVLNATGRLPERRFAQWLEAAYGCLSWPDSRIWCNQIGALGGAMRTSVVAATTAGILACDSQMYGMKTLIEGVTTIKQFQQRVEAGVSVEKIVADEIKRHAGMPFIMGYARPIAKGDERVDAMSKVAEQLGYAVGPHLKLAKEVDSILRDQFDESMNINGYLSAFMADEGYSAEETYRIFATQVMSGVTACYSDARDKPANTFLTMRCADVKYNGKPRRPVPEN